MSIALQGVLQVTVTLAGVIDTFVAGDATVYLLDFSNPVMSMYLGAT